MKPKTLAMAVPTMVVITIAFGALFVYIEEKKYQALLCDKELTALKESMEARTSLAHLANTIALNQAEDSTMAILVNSTKLNKLSYDEMRALVQKIKQNESIDDYGLSSDEIAAIQRLIAFQ